MRKIATMLLILGCAFIPSRATAQQDLDVRKMVTPAEFKAMGLNKLSDAELQALNQWLLRFAQTVYQAAATSNATNSTVIESRIDGEFECWEGDTVFKLMNGQIWQQTDYQYKYCYLYMPDVLIFQSGNGYKMRVEGVDGVVAVRRIK